MDPILESIQVQDGWAYAATGREVLARVPVSYSGDPVNIHWFVLGLLPNTEHVRLCGSLFVVHGDTWLYEEPKEPWPAHVIEKFFPDVEVDDQRLHGQATHFSADGTRWYGDNIEGVRTT